MEQRPKSGLLRDVRLMNLKEDLALKQKMNLLDVQYRYTLKTLQQRRRAVMLENRRLLLLRVCEPKATVNKNMIEIAKTKKARTDVREIHTAAGGRRSLPSKGSAPVGARRSVSAQATTWGKSGVVSARSGVSDEGRLSIMQMKDIATIDCISRKELARRQQEARGERERLERFQREALHQRVKAFIQKLNDTDDPELLPRDR